MLEKDPQQEQGDLEYIKYIIYKSVRILAILYYFAKNNTLPVQERCPNWFFVRTEHSVRASHHFTSRWTALHGWSTD